MTGNNSQTSTDPSRSTFAPRQLLARMGLQAKLIAGCSCVIALSLSASCWMYLIQSRTTTRQHASSQAIQMAQTLAMASETALKRGDQAELDRMSREMLKNLDLAAVAFFDTNGQAMSVASRDPDIDRRNLSFLRLPAAPTTTLMRPIERRTPTLGEFAMVTAPVLQSDPGTQGRRLGGYVTVCLAERMLQVQLAHVQFLQIVIGGLTLVITVTLVYALVHRTFQPIRQLVAATNRIAAGDLTARVAIGRPDVIGELARSFNEMINQVKDHQDTLEQTVEQRTAELGSANKQLSAEIAEKEDFIRAVSHDLNAPLRNIAGMATTLLNKHATKFDADVVHRLERIQKNVEVETDLINELLELSRIKTTRQKMEMVDVDAMARELGGVFENDLKTKGITLVFDNRLPVIHGERSRLRQVFQNLLDNAIKYMGDGPAKEIHVGAVIGQREAEFYVRDTGLGIDAEDVGQVFHIFRRGKNVTQGVSGKGVGLANVKSIIETYQGRIWVDSARGQGSTFRFTIGGMNVPAISSGFSGQKLVGVR
jgi:signal transduction histidine kinase